jgi:hypothetical protein
MAVLSLQAQDVYTSSGRNANAKKHKKQQGFDPSRLVFGGGFVANFGSGYSDFGLSPIVGYRFNDRITAGVGFGYEYMKSSIQFYNMNTGQYDLYPTAANIYTPSLWARVNIMRNIFADANFEYNMLRFNEYYYDTNGLPASGTFNVNVPCLLIGAGIKQSLGGRAYMFAEVLYDVLQNTNSPYFGTIIPRIGFLVGM